MAGRLKHAMLQQAWQHACMVAGRSIASCAQFWADCIYTAMTTYLKTQYHMPPKKKKEVKYSITIAAMTTGKRS